jgi:hypothetical protein
MGAVAARAVERPLRQAADPATYRSPSITTADIRDALTSIVICFAMPFVRLRVSPSLMND